VVGNAVEAATKQKWSIVMHEERWAGIECGEDWEGRIEREGRIVFSYRNTGSATIPEQEIKGFVQVEFGWCRIGDLQAFLHALELKINQNSDRISRIDPAKCGRLAPKRPLYKPDCCVSGTIVTADFCSRVVMKVA
jgi:hypothetical protein